MRLVVSIMLMVLCAARLMADCALTVEVAPWPNPAVERFDPARPPADLANPRGADSAMSIRISQVALQGTWDGEAYVIKDSAVLRVSGEACIRVPQGKGQISRHEQCHDILFRWCYEREAKSTIEDAMRGMPSTYMGSTRDEAVAKAAAELKSRIDGGLKTLIGRMNDISARFDALTKHGTSSTIDADRGVEMVKGSQEVPPLERRSR